MAMSNSDLTRRWFQEVWNEGRSQTIDELLAPDCVVHGLETPAGPRPDPKPARATFRAFWSQFRAALTEVNIVVDEVIAQGDMTAVRFTFSGKHTGLFMGAAPTAKPVHSTGMAFLRWRGGQMVEAWNEYDALGLALQTGATPGV